MFINSSVFKKKQQLYVKIFWFIFYHCSLTSILYLKNTKKSRDNKIILKLRTIYLKSILYYQTTIE